MPNDHPPVPPGCKTFNPRRMRRLARNQRELELLQAARRAKLQADMREHLATVARRREELKREQEQAEGVLGKVSRFLGLKAGVLVLLLPLLGACTPLPKVDMKTCSRLHNGYTRRDVTVMCRGVVKIIRAYGDEGNVALTALQNDPECRACQGMWNADEITVRYFGSW